MISNLWNLETQLNLSLHKKFLLKTDTFSSSWCVKKKSPKLKSLCPFIVSWTAVKHSLWQSLVEWQWVNRFCVMIFSFLFIFVLHVSPVPWFSTLIIAYSDLMCARGWLFHGISIAYFFCCCWTVSCLPHHLIIWYDITYPCGSNLIILQLDESFACLFRACNEFGMGFYLLLAFCFEDIFLFSCFVPEINICGCKCF